MSRQYTYDESNQLTQITTPDGQDYNVVFSYTSDTITKIEVRTGANTSTRIEEIVYTYFDTQTHSQDVGTDGDAMVSDTWFDATGSTLKQQSGGAELSSKMVYDGVGRVTNQCTGSTAKTPSPVARTNTTPMTR